MSIKLKRGTRAAINAQATQGLLQQGEPLFITDESRFAVATSATTYETFQRQVEDTTFFSAYLNAVQAPGTNNPFTAWTVSSNVGGGIYTAADGSYTVPRTGWYRCRISMLKNTGSGAGSLLFRINGANQLRVAYGSGPTTDYDTASGEDFYYITAGQKVQVIASEATANTWFGNAGSPVGRWIVEFKTASQT